MPQTPILGRGYGAPPQTLPPRRSGASRLRAFGPSIVPRRSVYNAERLRRLRVDQWTMCNALPYHVAVCATLRHDMT